MVLMRAGRGESASKESSGEEGAQGSWSRHGGGGGGESRGGETVAGGERRTGGGGSVGEEARVAGDSDIWGSGGRATRCRGVELLGWWGGKRERRGHRIGEGKW
jgi:hypothetical protein